ncbi:MAG: hypothetical protein ACFCU2_09215 [Acidimicrobiia bacterium]
MTTVRESYEIADGLWAIVLLQGAITLTTALEATVGALALGSLFAAGPVISLTLGGAVLALASARGLRLRRLWAKRMTVVAESLLLVVGVLGVGLSLLMTGGPVGLVTLVTTLVVPSIVLTLVVRNSQVFVPEGA